MKTWIVSISGRTSVTTNHFRALAKGLVRRGHKVVLIVDQREEAIRREDPELTVLRWPDRHANRPGNYWFVHDAIRRHRVGAVVGQFSAITPLMALGWAHRLPLRIAWHRTLSSQWEANTTYPRWLYRLLLCRRRLALRLATHTVANSDASRADLVEVLGVPDRRVIRIYNSVEDPLRNFPPPERDPARVVCVGALLPAKGQEDLLRAAALIRDLDFTLELIGDGPTRPRLERAAEHLGLAGRCTFAGAWPNREVLPRVAAAAVAVVPSLAEAFGLVNIEAMAVATPVVATRVGGIPEIIRDGVDGFLVPPGDPPAIAARLRQLLTDPGLRSRMGAEARRTFLDRFERSRAVEAQVDWLQNLAEEHPKSGDPEGRGT